MFDANNLHYGLFLTVSDVIFTKLKCSKGCTFFLNMYLEDGFKKVLVSPSLVLPILIQYTFQT